MNELFPLSALNQLVYCPHRAFLMHRCMEMEANEHVWRGRALHRRVDRGEAEQRGGVRIERSRWVSSETLGISGVADQVEHHPEGCHVVEFKRGRAPAAGVWPNDAVQVVAQALCLEEAGERVVLGVIYYERSSIRRPFELTEAMRSQTRAACAELVAVLNGTTRTSPQWGPRCLGCSMVDTCLPQGNSDAQLWAEPAPNTDELEYP